MKSLAKERATFPMRYPLRLCDAAVVLEKLCDGDRTLLADVVAVEPGMEHQIWREKSEPSSRQSARQNTETTWAHSKTG